MSSEDGVCVRRSGDEIKSAMDGFTLFKIWTSSSIISLLLPVVVLIWFWLAFLLFILILKLQ